MDAWNGTFTENVSLLKEAEAKAQAKVVFGLRVLTLLKLSSPNIILNNIGLLRPRGVNGTSKVGSDPQQKKIEIIAKAICNYHTVDLTIIL
jgi:hypothetical protein